MYHMFNKRFECDYGFVYDDSDNSVEYVNVYDTCRLSSSYFGEQLEFSDNSFNFAKLRMMGWTHLGTTWVVIGHDLCVYSVGDTIVVVKIGTNMEDGCTVIQFNFMQFSDNGLVDYRLRFTDSVWSYINKQDNTLYMDTSFICVSCPTIMISWLLNLESKNNFDGLMKSFDDLFGRDIGLIISNISGNRVVFRNWGALR